MLGTQVRVARALLVEVRASVAAVRGRLGDAARARLRAGAARLGASRPGAEA